MPSLILWRVDLESKCFKIAKLNIIYKLQFQKNKTKMRELLRLKTTRCLKTTIFVVLVQSFIRRKIEEDVDHKIRAKWKKWRCALGLLRDNQTLRIAMRPAMIYRAECWVIKKQCTQRLIVVKMRTLRQMSGKTEKNESKMNAFVAPSEQHQ